MSPSVGDPASNPEIPSTPMRFILDASVVIKLFIEDELSERALRLFYLLAADPPAELYVPDLFYIECTNVLWKYVRWANMPVEDARANVSDLRKLNLFSIPSKELVDGALEIAMHQSITAYDAYYIALAEKLDLPVITADEKLSKQFPNVLWLGAVEVP